MTPRPLSKTPVLSWIIPSGPWTGMRCLTIPLPFHIYIPLLRLPRLPRLLPRLRLCLPLPCIRLPLLRAWSTVSVRVSILVSLLATRHGNQRLSIQSQPTQRQPQLQSITLTSQPQLSRKRSQPQPLIKRRQTTTTTTHSLNCGMSFLDVSGMSWIVTSSRCGIDWFI